MQREEKWFTGKFKNFVVIPSKSPGGCSLIGHLPVCTVIWLPGSFIRVERQGGRAGSSLSSLLKYRVTFARKRLHWLAICLGGWGVVASPWAIMIASGGQRVGEVRYSEIYCVWDRACFPPVHLCTKILSALVTNKAVIIWTLIWKALARVFQERSNAGNCVSNKRMHTDT